ncbi:MULTISPECIES: hypothetical protein [unclassified Burkholderia]|uniref:hypothetical protein n=1 Tax=unclassified Burkholderia TaxID=2613784 RepID=UPI002B4B9B61|nr:MULTISPECIES: hypothetical protein [unclassified Burkholderia]
MDETGTHVGHRLGRKYGGNVKADSRRMPVILQFSLQQRQLARQARTSAVFAFLLRWARSVCGLNVPIPRRIPAVRPIFARPRGAKHIGGEHNTRRNLNKLAHLRLFLGGLNVEVRSSVARTAIPHFSGIPDEGGPSILHDQFGVRKYVAVSHRPGSKDRPLTTRRPVFPIG